LNFGKHKGRSLGDLWRAGEVSRERGHSSFDDPSTYINWIVREYNGDHRADVMEGIRTLNAAVFKWSNKPTSPPGCGPIKGPFNDTDAWTFVKGCDYYDVDPHKTKHRWRVMKRDGAGLQFKSVENDKLVGRMSRKIAIRNILYPDLLSSSEFAQFTFNGGNVKLFAVNNIPGGRVPMGGCPRKRLSPQPSSRRPSAAATAATGPSRHQCVATWCPRGTERYPVQSNKEWNKKCYRPSAIIHHPDRGGTEEQFKKLGACNELFVPSHDEAQWPHAIYVPHASESAM
jgi:hypothetical protein